MMLEHIGRFAPRPKVGTIWLIMQPSSALREMVVIKEVFWDNDIEKWFVLLGSLSYPEHAHLYAVRYFWESVLVFINPAETLKSRAEH